MVVSICRNGGAAALRSVSIFRTTGFRIAGQAVSPHRNIQNATGVDPEDIPLDDKDTLELLTHAENDISEYDM